ncbi:hypothetical protein Tco_1032069 [Tanacetum coccineum]|uniref:Tf2-1-like SH3-like domain-containing protein n=1 Tax=Tanacetum coccineum TaxID=301880 RepID=A0ABQ5GBW5_9ASTR
MSMTIQPSVKDKILTSKVENAPAEMLRDLDQQMEKIADDGCTLWIKLFNAAESVSDAIIFEYCLASSSGSTKSPVLWAEIGESSLIGPELVQETTDKVVLIKEKLKAARDRQKSCADNRRKPLEFEVGDRVMLKVSPWKGVIRFGKKGKLAPRYVGPFEILERIGPVAYQLRLPEELSGIEVDKTLRFVEEPVENLLTMKSEVHVKFGISSWRGSRVGGRSYLLSGAIDGSEANRIIRDSKQEVWNDCRSYKVRVGSNGNLLWEASVFLGRKKVETLKFAAMPFGLTNVPAVGAGGWGGFHGVNEPDDRRDTEGREDVHEVFQQRGSGVKRKLSRCGRNQMGRLWVVEGLTLERCSTFGKKDKLELSYVGPFEIRGWIGPIVRLRIFVLMRCASLEALCGKECRFYTSAGNPVKEILLKLNLPDHRIRKDGGEVKEFQGSFRHSDTERLSRSDEVLKLKNFKKDATLKLFKSTNQERYEHVDPKLTRSQDDKVTRWQNEIMLG